MATDRDNISRIEVVADGLKELADDVIFIGGACAQFYVTAPELRDYRQTKDVDCIIKIYTYSEYEKYSSRLRGLGFKHDTSAGAPIVRWVYNGIAVDTIPDETTVVGFSPIRWFKEGREYSIEHTLPSGRSINILPLSYFLASKLAASKERGGGDYLTDHDIEDIVNIIDGNEHLNEISSAPESVKEYVIQTFKKLVADDNFKVSIAGHLGYDDIAAERAKSVLGKMMEICSQ